MHPELWTMPGTGWTLKSYGFMLTVGFLSAVYLAMRRAQKVKCDPDIVLNCSFISLVTGIIGARLFFVVHYWDELFAAHPNPWFQIFDLTRGGLEFLGGLVPAMITVPLYLWIKGQSIRVYTDILTVSTMWALGVARLGCFLNGCCFGGVCTDQHGHARFAAAVEFPFGSSASVRQWENRQLTFPAELISDAITNSRDGKVFEAGPLARDYVTMTPEKFYSAQRRFEEVSDQLDVNKKLDPNSPRTKELERQVAQARKQADQNRERLLYLRQSLHFPSREDPTRSMTMTELSRLADQHPAHWVHPTQLYSSANGILLSIFLGRMFYRRKRHGVIFGLMMVTYPLARFSLELIRADNPLDTFGLTVSQGVSVGMFLAGCVYLYVLYKFFPERSPAAVPYVPPPEE